MVKRDTKSILPVVGKKGNPPNSSANNTKNGFCRVSRKCPCPACDHTDWCMIATDGSTAMCMRVPDGSYHEATNKNGETYYLHRLTDPHSAVDLQPTINCPRVERADADTLHNVNEALLSRLKLSETHRDNLRQRGLNDDEIDSRLYRTLPNGRVYLARELEERFGIETLLSVPGFFVKDKDGRKYPTLAGATGLLIPVRDMNGRIIALMSRADGSKQELDTKNLPRYSYLSSAKYGGPGSGAPPHVPLGIATPVEGVRLTEGPLKADVATALSRIPTIAAASAGSWATCLPLLRQLRAMLVRLSFDADANANANVARALKGCYDRLVAEKFAVSIETWPAECGKGIDDVLAADKRKQGKVLSGNAARAHVAAVLKQAIAKGNDRNGHSENRKPEKGGKVGGVKPISIHEARRVFGKWLYLKDPNVVDILLSVPAGNLLLETDPLWLFLKGPPGSGKTELLNALRNHSSTLFVSNLTPAALISGYGDPTQEDQSLLPQLDGKTLVIKDFTTILSMNDMARDEIFGILRDAYDGHAAKHFGTGRREYNSRFNLLAGVTSAIEGAWHLSQLGERFLVWAMDADDPLAQTKRAMENANKETAMRRELRNAADGVLAGLSSAIPDVPTALQEKTLTLAFLLARLRTYVARDRNDVVHRAPEVEVPTRIVKQLLRLGQGVALVRGRDCLTEEEFAIMRKVALDSVPSARKAMFNELLALKALNKVATIQYFADKCRITHSPAKRHLDDLHLLGLVERQGKDRKLLYGVTREVWQEWQAIRLDDPPV